MNRGRSTSIRQGNIGSCEIFIRKGFRGPTLNRIVEVITRNRDVWIDTMLEEELNLQKTAENPRRAAVITFIAFIVFGFIPLIPFLFSIFPRRHLFLVSSGLCAVAFVLWAYGRV